MSCKESLFKLLNESKDCYSDTSSCRDSGRSFSIRPQNRQPFCTIKVDGCLIKANNEQKCDFIIIDCNSKIFHFIELKGNDISKAYKQIFNTITIIRSKLKQSQITLTSDKIAIHIVCNLSTKANQKKDEIVESFISKLSITPKFYTKENVRL